MFQMAAQWVQPKLVWLLKIRVEVFFDHLWLPQSVFFQQVHKPPVSTTKGILNVIYFLSPDDSILISRWMTPKSFESKYLVFGSVWGLEPLKQAAFQIKRMGVSKNRGFYLPNHPMFNRVSPYKPSILGYHYFWKHPDVFSGVQIPIHQVFGCLGARISLGWLCSEQRGKNHFHQLKKRLSRSFLDHVFF